MSATPLQKIINDIKNKKVSIPEQYRVLISYLKDVEGGKLHYNSTETDITTGYGIYRAKHPSALIFSYIDTLATDIKSNSKEWKDKVTLDKLQNRMDPEVESYLTYLFYRDYLGPARLDLFDPSLTILVVNLYTNSTVGYWKSVQEGLRDIQKDGILQLPLSSLSTVDGVFGNKTRIALEAVRDLITSTPREKELSMLVFKKSILMAMKTYYTTLITSNPDKYLQYGKGWDNRIEELEHAKVKG